MTSWVVWAVVLVVAVLLGVAGTWFSVRTLRWFSAITAAAAVIAITRYGYGLTHSTSSNLVNAFTSGADRVIEGLLHAAWLGRSVPSPGPIGRGVVAFLILIGYRALEAWAFRHQASQLDTTVVGDGQSSIQPAGTPGAGSLTDGQRHERLTDELKFRLSAVSGGDRSCTLSPSLRAELLTIAAGELRDIRRQLVLWRVVRTLSCTVTSGRYGCRTGGCATGRLSATACASPNCLSPSG